nr:hypothetical protein [Chlamydiota bacterium]
SSPGFASTPNFSSCCLLWLTSSGQIALSRKTVAESRSDLIYRIALPIIIGSAVGLTLCRWKGYRVASWLQDFALDSAAFGIYIWIIYRYQPKSVKIDVAIDLLFVTKACASFILSKSRNSSFHFSAHCAHSISSAFLHRTVIVVLDNCYGKREAATRTAVISRLASIALIIPINALFKTKLHTSWLALGGGLFICSSATFLFSSPSSPIATWLKIE